MSTEQKSTFAPDYAVPAGETVKEYMDGMGFTQKEFAVRLGMTEQSLIRMYTGKQSLTYETANRLEKVTGVSANFWNKREQLYRERVIKTKEMEQGRLNKDWVRYFPIKMLQKFGFIAQGNDYAVLYSSVLQFFGVATPEAWDDLWKNPKVAARRSPCFANDPYKAAAWIRMGELTAHTLNCQPTKKLAFSKLLPEFRKITREEPCVFMPKLQEMCCSAGVALVFVATPYGLKWNGATKWLHDTAMIIVNAADKKENVFWFSFFHEAYHVLNDGKQNLLINDEDFTDKREKNAENFAIRQLFGRNALKSIEEASSEGDIRRLADKLGLSEGIIAGQWQFLHKDFDRFSDMIRRVGCADAQTL